ncbi:MAG: zinc-dependent peptidase [Candidatus Bipolaricaulota bacterium]|nr:MAG: zinc-dependent peptidase [Candidatus Bipolaricaulota bacterium]
MGWWRRRRRARVMGRPFPESWGEILRRNVPFSEKLPVDDRRELEGLIQVFLDEKHFEGAGGLRMTDEIRVTVAAHACLLLLHRETELYPRMSSIIVYPRPYRARQQRRGPAGTVEEGTEIRFGESSTRGAVVLAWDAVRAIATDPHGCGNVVVHEFVHQLDAEDGHVEGTPPLPGSLVATWAQVLGDEFESLREEIARGVATLIGAYGASSPAEFFAVATECFFMRPRAMRRRHPELYDALASYYRQDPAAWPGPASR